MQPFIYWDIGTRFDLWQLKLLRFSFTKAFPKPLPMCACGQNKSTGDRSALLIFQRMEAIEQFKSFRNEFSKALKMIDEEGVITIEPSGGLSSFLADQKVTSWYRWNAFWISTGKTTGSALCGFMHRYAEANGMAYGEKP